jgi:MFS transporter, DHA1 family, multidrug resistance protein
VTSGAVDGPLREGVAVGHEFATLCVIGFLAYCSYAICRTPLLPLLARELGADAPMVGFIVGASTLTGIAVKLPAGAWSDVIGRRPLLLFGAVVFALMPFTYLGIASLATLVGLRFLHGSATAVFGPVASATISELAPAGRRATWLGTYSTFQGAGQALGPVLAGYLIASRRYDMAFLLAGTFALAAPFLVTRLPSMSSTASDSRPLHQFGTAILEVGRHPLILMTSLAQAAQFVLNGTLNAFLPLFARDTLGLSPSALGWLFALQTVTTLATRPLIGMLSDRIGRRGVIVAGLTSCSAAVLLVSVAQGVADLVIAILLYAVGVAVTTAATSAFITDLSRRARYGTAHGVFGTIYDIGDALGPITAGVLVARVGYGRMFQVMAAVALSVAAAFFISSRHASRLHVAPGRASG